LANVYARCEFQLKLYVACHDRHGDLREEVRFRFDPRDLRSSLARARDRVRVSDVEVGEDEHEVREARKLRRDLRTLQTELRAELSKEEWNGDS